MRPGFLPRTITRSASRTASSILWVTIKIGASGNLFTEPQFQQFATQIFCCQNIERRKWLIHKQDFGFDDQGAGKADSLFHSAGKLFRIGGFKAVESHRVQHFNARLRLSMAATPRASSGASTFSRTLSQGNSAKL